LVSTGPLKARIIHGDEESALGWVSPSFGIRVPSDQVIFDGNLKGTSTIKIEVF
jgi:hypothetical protein